MKITIGTRVLTHISASINRTIDTPADGFNAEIPWIPGEDPELDKLIVPRSFTEATAKINDKLLATGRLYKRTPSLTNDGSTLFLEFFSNTKNIIDSNTKPPYQRVNISLKSLANELCKPYGLNVFFNTNVTQEINEQFKKVTIGPGETIAGFLGRLAAQKGILLSSTVDGDVLFLQANTKGVPVASITEGDLQAGSVATGQTFSAVFDDTKVFSDYRAIAESPGAWADPIEAVAKDPNIPVFRYKSIAANNETKGGIQKSVDWAKNQALVDSLTIPFPVTSFYTPKGDLWRENTLITATSPMIFINTGFNFLIKSVEYISDSTGETSLLTLIPPQMYTKEAVKEPWA